MTARYALTVRQPWADLIMAGIKPVENRTWEPPSTLPRWWLCPKCEQRKHYPENCCEWWPEPDGPFPFTLWIHAGQQIDLNVSGQAWRAWGPLDLRHPIEGQRLGALLGSVTVTGCHHATDCVRTALDPEGAKTVLCSRWAQGGDMFHWTLTDPQPLDTPVPMRGQQRLWTIDKGALT